MELKNPGDLFALQAGDAVTKRNLFDLIQYSKIAKSLYWGGLDMQIGNTPQQGINWVGHLPACHAVIIKTRPGSYEDDGWINREKTSFRYSFKARRGEVSFKEKANKVLVNQPQFKYPIFFFTENKDSWCFEGAFFVAEIQDRYVVLERGLGAVAEQGSIFEETQYYEGGRKYVAHLMVERNKDVVKVLKSTLPWVCDICALSFVDRYGVEYIEAHHKVPISTYSSAYSISPLDFALLCPNCHRAVHVYMKIGRLEYHEIRERLGGK